MTIHDFALSDLFGPGGQGCIRSHESRGIERLTRTPLVRSRLPWAEGLGMMVAQILEVEDEPEEEVPDVSPLSRNSRSSLPGCVVIAMS